MAKDFCNMRDPCRNCSNKKYADCLSNHYTCQDKVEYEYNLDKVPYEPNKRIYTILTISRKRELEARTVKEGQELDINEGYDYEVNSSLPEIADGIAKMALEFDKMEDLGENAGSYFLQLIVDFYGQLKENNETN